MRKGLGNILAVVMVIAGLIYTGTRTVDLIDLTLPADKAALGYVALFFLDGGVLIWAVLFTDVAEGPIQRGLSAVMIGVDIVGVVTATLLDSQLEASLRGVGTKPTQDAVDTAILVCTAVILANVVAMLTFHLTSPARLREAVEAEHKGKIQEKILHHMGLQSDNIAAEVAPLVAEDWARQLRAQTLSGIKELPPPTVATPTSINDHQQNHEAFAIEVSKLRRHQQPPPAADSGTPPTSTTDPNWRGRSGR